MTKRMRAEAAKTPSPFHIDHVNSPQLAKDLRGQISRLEREAPDLVPIILLEHEGRSVVVMDEADAVFLRR